MLNFTSSTDENTSPCVRSKRLRLYRHNAHTCVNMCARGAGTHGDVLNVHTETCLVDTLGFQRVTRTHHDHNDTQHNTTQRQRQTETEKEDRDREEKTEQERQDKRREKIHFAVWWCMAFFVGVVIFWLVPFAHETWASQVRFNLDFSAPWPVNSFLLSAN